MKLRSLNPNLAAHFKTVPKSSHQYGLKNIYSPETCQKIIDAAGLAEKYPNSQGRLNIVDVFAGYGLLSSMLNWELKPKNHIVIENTKDNAAIWRNRVDYLQKTTGNQENFRFHNMDGHAWETYDTLMKQMKVIEPPVQSRDSIHDEFLIVANLTSSKYGESLFAQWIKCCADCNWLQKYGRVRMLLLVRESTTLKFLAGPNCPKRNRAALKRDVYTDSKLIAVSDTQPDAIGTAGEQFDPNLLIKDQPIILPSSSILPIGGDLSVVEVVPKNLHDLEVSEIDHLAQVLMYKASYTVKEALVALAPGADEDLGNKLPSHILAKTARQLSAEDLLTIYEVYHSWPFKPTYEETLSFLTEETRTF